MNTDVFTVKLHNKHIDIVRTFVRTDTGRFFDITGCYLLTNGRFNEDDGLLPRARQVSAQYVADLVVKAKTSKAKRKASKNSRCIIIGITREMK